MMRKSFGLVVGSHANGNLPSFALCWPVGSHDAVGEYLELDLRWG